MRKRLISALLASTLAFSVIGCSPRTSVILKTKGTSPEKNINLNVWIMPNSATPDKDFMEIIKPFLDKNPNIKVTPNVLDSDTALAKITGAVTSGEAPDITQLNTNWVATVGATGVLEDLNPYYKDFGGDEAFLKSTLSTTVIEGKKEKYAVPWFIDSKALFYRIDACEKAGVDPAKDFATWDSFKLALKKLNVIEINGKKMTALGMPGKNDTNVVNNFSSWIWGAGGEYIKDGKVVINSAQSLAGVKYYTELAVDGLMSKVALGKNTQEVEALFDAGEYATVFSGAYLTQNLKNEFAKDSTKALDPKKVGVALIPEGPKGRVALLGGSTLAMYKTSKNKAEAAKLLTFLSSTDAQVAYSKKEGNLPTNAKALEDKFITDDPMLLVFKQQLQYGKSYPSIASWAPTEEIFKKQFSNIWDNVMEINGKYSVTKTKKELDDAVKYVNNFFDLQDGSIDNIGTTGTVSTGTARTTPSIPATKPSAPTTPVTPNIPTTPETPSAPTTPVTPNMPTTPETPSVPTTPVTPTTPISTTDQDNSLWTLKFADDFNGKNGTTVDSKKWSCEVEAAGYVNHELENYTNSTDNVFQKDGNLVIKTKKEADGSISSGRVITKDKVNMKYGRIDARMKLPAGQGMWPAFWMMPQADKYGGWAASGEIDIMENRGSALDKVAGTLHYGATAPNNKNSGATYTLPQGQSVTDFHVYSVEWEPGEIRWYVDGHLYQTQNNWNTNDNNGEKYAFPAPFDQDFYVILNLAFGGDYDNLAHDDTKLPGEMLVDYVHAYDLTGRPYKTAVEPGSVPTTLPADAKQADSTGNLLSNGDFSKTVQDNYASDPTIFGDKWNFVYGTTGSGTQSIDTIGGKNYDKIHVDTVGANNYSIQLMQETTVGMGRWYTVSFDAKASAARKIDMKVGGGPTRNYTMYSDMYSCPLTTEVTHFERTFHMTQGTDLIARLEFELGLDPNSVWIGNVKLKETTKPADGDVVINTPLSDGNLVYNGAFDKGTVGRMSNWNLSVDGATATASVPDNTRELNVAIIDGSTTSSAITLTQSDIALKAGKNYNLAFRARADNARTIQVGLQSKDGKITYLEDKTITLTKDMQNFTLPMVMDKVDDSKAILVFKLGGDNNKVYLDDVSLRAVIDYSKVNIYPLRNGDFSQGTDGLAGWNPLPSCIGDATSTISVVNGEAKIAITKPGAQQYSIMLNQEKMNLSSGVEYKVAFDARTTADRSIFVSAENATYTQYFSKTVPLTATSTHYEYTFVMPKDDVVDFKLQMGTVGANMPDVANIFLSKVQFEVNKAPVKKPTELIASTTNNKVGQAIDTSFTDDSTWRGAITDVKINDISLSKDKYTITAGKIAFTADNFSVAGSYNITVSATGYGNAKVVQVINAAVPVTPKWSLSLANWDGGPGADAVMTVDSSKTNIDVKKVGTENWNVQLKLNPLTIINGHKYKVSFDAKSDVARSIEVVVQNSKTYATYLQQQVDLAITADVIHHDYEFTMDKATDDNIVFLFNLGKVGNSDTIGEHNVFFDNISLVDETSIPNSANLVSNGSFATDTTGWKDQWNENSAGSIAVNTNKELVATTTTAGLNAWSSNIYYDGLTLEKGKTYTLKFKARSDADRLIDVNVGKQLSAAPWFTNYFQGAQVDLTTSMKDFSYDFTVTEDTNPDLRIVFDLGPQSGKTIATNNLVYFDDISLSEKK